LNNPVSHKDSKGLFALAVVAAATICGALIGGTLGAAEAVAKGEDVGRAATKGALTGAAMGVRLINPKSGNSKSKKTSWAVQSQDRRYFPVQI